MYYIGTILSRMVREGLTEKLAFEQRPEGSERERHARDGCKTWTHLDPFPIKNR